MSYKISFDETLPEYGIMPTGTSIWMGQDGGRYLDALEAVPFTVYAEQPDGAEIEIVSGTFRGDKRDRDYPLEMTRLFWARAARPDATEPRTEALRDLEPRRLVYGDRTGFRWHREWGYAEKIG